MAPARKRREPEAIEGSGEGSDLQSMRQDVKTYHRYFPTKHSAQIWAAMWRQNGSPEAKARKLRLGWAVVLNA